jgi:hypothetical protein
LFSNVVGGWYWLSVCDGTHTLIVLASLIVRIQPLVTYLYVHTHPVDAEQLCSKLHADIARKFG